METFLLQRFDDVAFRVPPSGGSLEIGNAPPVQYPYCTIAGEVPPSGGSLEIGNGDWSFDRTFSLYRVPPSGGSLEIGNLLPGFAVREERKGVVPPSGGSLEIGNCLLLRSLVFRLK